MQTCAHVHTHTHSHTHTHTHTTQTLKPPTLHSYTHSRSKHIMLPPTYPPTYPPIPQHRHTRINPKSHHDAHTQYLNKAGEHGEHSMGQRVPGMGTLSPRLYRSQHSCVQTPPTAHQTHPSQAICGYLTWVLPVPASIDPSIPVCTPTPPPPHHRPSGQQIAYLFFNLLHIWILD